MKHSMEHSMEQATDQNMEQNREPAARASTALVLGASGGVGGEVARTLLRHGWRVRALIRDLARAPRIDGVEWLAGDAMQRADVVAAANGVQVIVHAVNPPGYRDWDTLVLPMLENTIAAAGAAGARILLPGTLYNYGAATGPVLSESTPQAPSSRKGEIRVAMERRLHAAAQQGVRSLVVRAGDFFGPRAGSSWFSQGLVTPGRPLARLLHPGTAGVGHAWAYLPDLADTMVRLLEHEARLAVCESVHFGGHWDADGAQMVGAIRRVSGNPALKVWRLPWGLLALAAPFVAMVREMREVRYLWRQPFALDNARLLALLGSETHTPLDEAVLATLQGLGCLDPLPAKAVQVLSELKE